MKLYYAPLGRHGHMEILLWAWCIALIAIPARCDGSQYEAMFVFGDSLVDPGNDQKLVALARADRPPYGRDLASHSPSGRFSNGLLVSDIVASLAGLPYPPAYMLQQDNVLQGTSFASPGAGIMNLTGILQHDKINFFQQVGYFSEARDTIVQKLGMEAAALLISRSLFLICFGNNDFLSSYFENPTRSPSDSQQFRALLISFYEQNVLEMYSLGGRKFAVVSVGPVGCIPFELLLEQSKGGECVDSINEDVQTFNEALEALAARLQASLPFTHFTFLDSFDIVLNIIHNPPDYGFVQASTACCGSGPYNGVPCFEGISTICQDASQYVFWDFAHPTQAVNELLANRFWAGQWPDVRPLNLRDLASV